MYNLKSHDKNIQFGGRGQLKEFKKSDYSLKIYDKGKQYNLSTNLIRLELRVLRSRFLNRFDVYSIEDLLEQKKLYKLFEVLIDEYENLIIVDDWEEKQLDKETREVLLKYTNSNFWINLKDKKSWKVFNNHRLKFNKLLEEQQLLETKKEIKQKLIVKFWELLNKGNKELFQVEDL